INAARATPRRIAGRRLHGSLANGYFMTGLPFTRSGAGYPRTIRGPTPVVVTSVMQFPCRGITESNGYTRHMSRGSTAEILFDLLASAPAGQTLSGQALALRCGVSRAAIWKQVATLRALG